MWQMRRNSHKLEALKYFQLSDMRDDDRNVVTERVGATVLQLYLIWTHAQVLEHVIDFHMRISRDFQNLNFWQAWLSITKYQLPR